MTKRRALPMLIALLGCLALLTGLLDLRRTSHAVADARTRPAYRSRRAALSSVAVAGHRSVTKGRYLGVVKP